MVSLLFLGLHLGQANELNERSLCRTDEGTAAALKALKDAEGRRVLCPPRFHIDSNVVGRKAHGAHIDTPSTSDAGAVGPGVYLVFGKKQNA
jgi:hypothetical protein